MISWLYYRADESNGWITNPARDIWLYNVLQIQVRQANQVYFVIIGGAKIVLIVFSAGCVYGAIRLDGIVAIALVCLGGSMTIFLGIILNSWAEFHMSSCKALGRLQGQVARDVSDGRGYPRKWWRMKVRALPPLQIYVFNLYYIDKPLVLLVFRVISEAIIFLLVNL